MSFALFSNANEMMAAYAFQIPLEHLDAGFHLVQIACFAVVWVAEIALLVRTKRQIGAFLKTSARDAA